MAACVVADTLQLKAEKASAHSDDINSVAFSPDGKTIVSGSADQTIKVWSAGQPLSPIPTASRAPLTPSPPPLSLADTLELKAEKQGAHSSAVTSVAFSPDGKTIASGSGDRTVKVWGTHSLSQLPPPTCLLTAPCPSAPTDASSLAELKSQDAGSPVLSVAFNNDGQKIVSGHISGTIKVWDSGEPFQLLP